MPQIDRTNMPQIRSADLHDFVGWAAGEGVHLRFGYIKAAALQTKQAVSAEHAEAMDKAARRKPLVVSLDGVVLDGNHRAAVLAAFGELAVAWTIPLPFEEAKALMFRFPGAFTKEENER